MCFGQDALTVRYDGFGPVSVGAGILREGYATQDAYYWVCASCFSDFVELFAWKVAPRC